MFDNAGKDSQTISKGKPSLALLPVYWSLQEAGNLDAEPHDYVTVPAAIYDLPGMVFGLRCEVVGAVELDPVEDILILWYGGVEDMLERLPLCAGLVSSDHRGRLLVYPGSEQRDPRILQHCGILVGILNPHRGSGEIVRDCGMSTPEPAPAAAATAETPPADIVLVTTVRPD